MDITNKKRLSHLVVIGILSILFLVSNQKVDAAGLYDFTDWLRYDSNTTINSSSSSNIVFSTSKNLSTAGIYVKDLPANQDYAVSFDIKKTSGTLTSIGGHSVLSNNTEWWIDGKKQTANYSSGAPLPNDSNWHRVVVQFDSRSGNTDRRFFIQPGRGQQNLSYKVELKNMTFKKGYADEIISQKDIQYAGKIDREGDGINTLPYGVSGYKTLYYSGDIYDKEVRITKEAVTGRATWAYITVNGKASGWIDKAAINIEKILSEKKVDYKATINRGTDGINTRPFGVEGYEYIASSNSYLNQEVTVLKEAATRRAVWAFIRIGNIEGWIDKAGLTIKPKLKNFGIETTIDIANNAIDLKWNDIADSNEPYVYKVYQKKPGASEFQSISTAGLTNKVKVLNVYPDVEEKISYTTWDGTRRTNIAKSASAEMWMEQANPKNAKGYGVGLIDVTPVTNVDFNDNPSSYIYNSDGSFKYDVLFFGNWDNHGGKNARDISDSAVVVMEDFLNSGRGILFGHDSVRNELTYPGGPNYRAFALKYLNVKFRDVLLHDPNGFYHDEWNSGFGVDKESEIIISQKGLLTSFPWDIGTVGTQLTVPYTHTVNQIVNGDIWMRFDSKGNETNPLNHYLTTWNNAAMIQTGHSNGAATHDEQQVIANTLFYLSQLTSATEVKDRSARDIDVPVFNSGSHTITNAGSGKIKITFPTATDNGSSYEYYVEGKGADSGTFYESEKVKQSITTGLQGYSYVFDNNPNTIPNGTVNVTSAEITYSPDASKNYLHVAAVDKAGNKSATKHYQLDVTAPTITVSSNPTTWTNGSVTLSVTASDSGSGVDSIVLPNGNTVKGTTATYAVTANGTYTFTSKDIFGNTATKSFVVSNIDKTIPNGTISGNPTSWTNDNVTLTFTGTDTGGAGVKRVRKHDGTWVNGSSASQTVTANGTYTFRVEDNAGNIKDVSVVVNRMDKSVPTGTIDGNPTAWTNSNVMLSITGTDTGGSGVKRVRKPDGTWTNGNKNSQTVLENGTYTFQVEDNAGNVGNVSVTVNKIDKVVPNGTISGNPASWTNENATLSIAATDSGGSGVKRIQKPDDTWVNGSSASYSVSANGSHLFKVEDNAGNIKDVSVTVSKIDKTLPNGTITGNPTSWTNSNPTLTFSASDTGGSGVKRVRKPDGTWVNGTSTSQVVSSNGTYTFGVEDNAGNIKDISVVVNRIDKTTPTGSITGNPTDWTKNDVTLSFATTDSGGAGVNRVQKPDGTWVTGSTTSYSVSSNGVYTFKVEDNAGNLTSVSTTVSKIDQASPSVSITQTPGATIVTKEPVSITVSATDTLSGVKSILQTNKDAYAGRNLALQSNKFRKGSSAGGITTSLTNEGYLQITSTSGNSNWVTGWDMGRENIEDFLSEGDTFTVSFTMKSANTTKIPNVYMKSGMGYYTMTGKMNNEWSTVSYTGKWKDANAIIPHIGMSGIEGTILIKDWKIEKGSVTSWTSAPEDTQLAGGKATFMVSQNGKYDYEITDNAGNVTRQSHQVSNVDTTPPVISNVSQNPTGWTNKNVTITANALDNLSGVKSIEILQPYQGKNLLLNGNKEVTSPSEAREFVQWGDMSPIFDEYGVGEYTISFDLKTSKAGSVQVYAQNGSATEYSIGAYRVDATTSYKRYSVKVTASKQDAAETKSMLAFYGTYGSGIKSDVKNVKIEKGWGGDSTFSLHPSETTSNGTASFVVTENGTYTIQVTDKVGNVTQKNHTVSNIDKVKPTLSVTANETSWTNENVTLTFKSGDTGGSGYYRTKLPNGSFSSSSTATYDVAANGTYSFVAYDVAGNEITHSINVTNIDKTLPTIGNAEIKNVTQDTFDVYVYNVSDAGGSQINRVQFPTWTNLNGQDDLLKDWQTSAQASGENLGNGTWRFTVERKDHNWEFGDYTVHVYAFDNAGNRLSISTSYQLRDQVKPTIQVSGNPTVWLNGDITLTVNGMDVHTGVKSITLPDGTVITKNGAKGATVSHTYVVSQNGSYTFKVTDMYDNVVTQTVTVGKIDKIKPTLTLTNNTTNWTNQDVALVANSSDAASGISRIVLPNGVISNQSKVTYIVKENGEYLFTLYDEAGNKTEQTEIVNRIDKIIPSQSTIEIEVN